MSYIILVYFVNNAIQNKQAKILTTKRKKAECTLYIFVCALSSLHSMKLLLDIRQMCNLYL